MFEFFKKRLSASPTNDLEKSVSLALEDVKQKWLQFHEAVHLKEDVTLATKIDIFSQPIQQFIQNNYPVISKGPTEVFWLIVLTAILESGTHPTEEVNSAITALQAKYAKSSGGSPSQSTEKPSEPAPPQRLRAPIATILPSFLPVLMERGVPGYESVHISLTGERRLTRSQIRALLAAAAYLGALEHVGNLNFDATRVQEILTRTLLEVPDLTVDQRKHSLHLIDRFFNCKVIRANHSFDDWLCEVWWPEFQTIPYAYPSAMSDAVAYGLGIRQSLSNFTLEY